MEKPRHASVDEIRSNNLTSSLEIRRLSRLRSPGRLKPSHRTDVGTCRSRSSLLAIETKCLQGVFVFSIRGQPKQGWGAWQHSAGLISANIMLQARKCHLNLVPNCESLPGPALLLPVPDADILVHSLPCALSVFYRNSLPVSKAKIKRTKNDLLQEIF